MPCGKVRTRNWKRSGFFLAEAGARVVVFADMDEEMAKVSSEESKRFASNKEYKTSAFKMNVQDDQSVQDMVDHVVKEYGRLDYAVNAAGVSRALVLSQ
jgi:NAD(P)-dependent dehydrogenase (short-subunit alcohol dehydrogenase family)